MKMQWIDWMVVLVPLVVVTAIGAITRRYMKSVADFMTGGRAAGRYLLTTAEMMAGMGLISVVATFESQYRNGFAYGGPWSVLLCPLTLFLTMTGYLIYRYRETWVMTMAQFFEVRYSKRFRIFTGIMAAVSGIVNYGIFPAVGGRFFVYYCGLPETTWIFGHPVQTFGIVMALFLAAALLLVLMGGQITILVTDSVQAMFSYVMFVVVVVVVFCLISRDQMVAVLENQPPGKSFLNPWDISQLQDFNIWYWLIGAFGGYYSMMAWQGGHAMNASAANPHEAKMGKILGTFRGGFSTVMFSFLIIAAYTYMHHPAFAAQAAVVTKDLSRIDNEAIRIQMTVPVALSHLLPVGIKGVFCAIMLFLLITTDVSYLHSWGSIVIQDCILPFRKKPFTSAQQIWLIRLSIIGVAVFAWFFSYLFYQTTYILMFFALTSALYLGGAGSCIVGGFYSRWGTTAGAWGAMIIGAVVAVLGFIGEQTWRLLHPTLMACFPGNEWLAIHPDKFPINGQWVWGISMASAILCYVVLSLLTYREGFNLDRMLHRGKYAVDETGKPLPKIEIPKMTWRSFIGIDANMTSGDRRLTYLIFFWSYLNIIVSLIVLFWNIVPRWRWPMHWWTEWFFINSYYVGMALGAITTVWFIWGGIRDLRRLFVRLRAPGRNLLDDGRIIDHRSADETPVENDEEMEDEPDVGQIVA